MSHMSMSRSMGRSAMSLELTFKAAARTTLVTVAAIVSTVGRGQLPMSSPRLSRRLEISHPAVAHLRLPYPS